MRRISVGAGGADFASLGAAIESIPRDGGGGTVVLLEAGTYREKVEIRAPRVRIVGRGASSTKIVFGDCASKQLPDGRAMGTFNSYTLYAGAPDIRIEELTIENSAGDGREVGQGVALYADADRLSFRNCAFIGCQDTLCLGPLPRDPIPKGVNPVHDFAGFEAEPALRSFRQYYEGCFIRGDVDFIFGSAAAFFAGCELSSRDRGEAVNGYITAASTYPAEAHGFVFRDCRLTGEAGPDSVYLGRPWRSNARTAFVDCWMGAHIKKEAWDDWDKAEARELARYCEGGSMGPGADLAARVGWARPIAEADRGAYSIAAVLAGSDGWDPRIWL
jgi:pectinesterase